MTRPEWQPVWNHVRRILKVDWDPIGVWTPEDEYDCYAGPIVSMLFRHVPTSEVADYLEQQAAEAMECPLPRAVHEAVAATLLRVSLPDDHR